MLSTAGWACSACSALGAAYTASWGLAALEVLELEQPMASEGNGDRKSTEDTTALGALTMKQALTEQQLEETWLDWRLRVSS